MPKAIKSYILRVFIASIAIISAMIIVNNAFNNARIDAAIANNKKTVADIISSNKSYLIQEMYLGNKDALQRRLYSISSQIHQSTGQVACVQIENVSSCNSHSKSPAYKVVRNLLNSEVKVLVFPTNTQNESYYKKYFIINLVVILLFIVLISYWTFKNSLLPYLNSKEELEVQKGIQQSNDKICHDIKSPLTSLEYFLGSIKDKLSESERLIGKQSLERINDIILTLKTSNKATENSDSTEETIIYPLIKRIIAEKRIEYKSNSNISIKLKNNLQYGVFSKINKSSLSRALSNLINNSIEAQNNNKPLDIDLTLDDDLDYCTITIKDNGVGIQKDKQDKIFSPGVSFNKANGKGIGLSEAKLYIEKVGGSLSLTSTVDQGTTIQIKLKKATPPKWFKRSLHIPSKAVCIIDDDQSIHTLWDQKLSSVKINILHFSTSAEFESWTEGESLDQFDYLFDLELLGSPLNGLELIEKYNLAISSTLVTSHFDNLEVRDIASRLRVGVIPKESVTNLKLKPRSLKTSVEELILIDDDPLVHTTWKMLSERKGHKLHCFFTVEDFFTKAINFTHDTHIYIDSNLGKNIKGELEAKRIYEYGFKNITLATGQAIDILPSWILDQQAKGYPF